MVTHDDELASRVPRILTLADGLIVNELVQPSAVAAQEKMRWIPVSDSETPLPFAAQEHGGRGMLAPMQSVSQGA
jgi:hypothetical protein